VIPTPISCLVGTRWSSFRCPIVIFQHI
jgi:hypothetical protein